MGIKELKAYYERIRRPNRESKRLTFNGASNIHRPSNPCNKQKDSPLLNTRELFEKKENQQEVFNELERCQNVSLLNRKKTSNSVLYLSRAGYYHSSDGASIQKIRKCHDSYEEHWQKQQQDWFSKTGFPSIIKIVNQERGRRT